MQEEKEGNGKLQEILKAVEFFSSISKKQFRTGKLEQKVGGLLEE